MICNGWRPPACIIRPSSVSALVVLPASIASVKSHGGTPPASPRNGSISAKASLRSAPYVLRSVDRIPSSRPASSPSHTPSWATAALSRSQPRTPRCGRPATPDALWPAIGGDVFVTVPTALTASTSFFGIRPPTHRRARGPRSRAGCRGTRAAAPGRRRRTARRRGPRSPACRSGTAASAPRRRPVGVSYSSPSNSSTIIDRSPSPTSSSTRSWTAVRRIDSSSPVRRCVVMSSPILTASGADCDNDRGRGGHEPPSDPRPRWGRFEHGRRASRRCRPTGCRPVPGTSTPVRAAASIPPTVRPATRRA